MGGGSPDCLWNIRAWQFHRLFWQQNEKSEDIILLPKARVSPFKKKKNHKESNRPVIGVSWGNTSLMFLCRQTLKTANNRLPHVCCMSAYKGKVLSTCFCFADGLKMNPQWHRQMIFKIQENSEATQAPTLPSSSTILTIKTTHT